MLALNFSPFPNLETERLSLRRVVNDDVNEIFYLRSNREVMKYIPRPLAITPEDALAHIATIDATIDRNEGINWAITLKNSDKLIGIIGHYRIQPQNYRSEVGYILHPDYHGKGFIPEALKKVIAFGFNEMKLHTIEAVIDPNNTASEKVLLKSGFSKEAHFIENQFYEGRFLDTVIYSLLNKS
ncbi:ribosomal-protein-alanine N-acetyltransferase [Flavobacterium sp. 28A]|uniref:GNAT family N-acetyltransferase n=1 Tax=Flavobacterium sp. 28A TaxID=2735895 RepID=UPI00156FDF44|nr:GNAT family N-acetyltransferase [Flavobacterium sp. 28A]NRT15876.1 ribosomal-protein-alanine N-acetyltransferase [Flavobacterium sp. 28A]